MEMKFLLFFLFFLFSFFVTCSATSLLRTRYDIFNFYKTKNNPKYFFHYLFVNGVITIPVFGLITIGTFPPCGGPNCGGPNCGGC